MSAELLLNPDLEEVKVYHHKLYQIAAISAPGPDKTLNEDSLGIAGTSDDELIFTVADGVGGHPSGAEASRLAIQTFHDYLNQQKNGTAETMISGFEQANEAVLKMGVGAACTLIAVHLSSDSLRYYCVGDSALKVIGGRGKEKFSSKGHSSFDLGHAAGLVEDIDEETGSELKRELTNYLGSRSMYIEVGRFNDLAIRDLIIIGSDGLFDNCNVALAQADQSSADLKEFCQYLYTRSKENMLGLIQGDYPAKPDDFSLIIARLENS